ncbi:MULTISPECIES: DUF3365 domain-containing protein [unclassified Polaribacter]|jgi:cytochrome c553|uniref:Tll0287-like domain-containing protein n=1 Tax=unclassified Polaribacter TaxID=196858 RepID=UPI000380188A|nr:MULTISPECIES: DUF3365 domain-containing protein [unclassified Polaribacter]TXD50826.1 DUF3365 domain-containing protein [Polaribacter sp. IC063]TXD57615.1 DUF3365 domain-containing protein [Polaribacter sp. IC066]
MKYYILILVFLGLFSCKKSNEPSYGKKKITKQIHAGKKLMENNCYVCHNPTTSHDDRIAPPMVAIKKHYISKEITKQEFISSMQNWIEHPTEENSKMPGAIKKFGVMPKQYFSKETVQQISEYMFDFEIASPEWFEKHQNEERGKGKGAGNGQGKGKMKGKMMQEARVNEDTLSYSERGLKYALSTKAVLGKNLMGKIQKEGTLAALAFCETAAYPLTDSMAVVHKATIKRVSDKPRNPNNKANKEELGYIKIFKNNTINNSASEPIVVKNATNVSVYYPITTNGMCLQCHGKPKEQISGSTIEALSKLYPNDLAVGYDINEIRGVWSVSFKK